MIELTQHIEMLLLENDFVIIPDFGGFVAHYNQAKSADTDNMFCPPTRTIGFNPHLTLNDGLLVQSYMTVHDIDFPGATKMVNDEVKLLIDTLHEDGKVELPNIGELHYTIRQTYEFVPYNERVITPSLYGLEAFRMLTLADLKKKETVMPVLNEHRKEGRSYNIRINKTFVRNAVAVAVAVFTFFALSIPIENTYMAKGSYAQLLPVDVFETIEGQSVLTTPVSKDDNKSSKKQTKKEKKAEKKAEKAEKKAEKKNNNNNSNQQNNPQNNQQPAQNNNNQQPAQSNQPANNNGNGNNQQQPAQNNNNQQQPAQNNNNNQQPAQNGNNNSSAKPADNKNTNNQPANNSGNNKPANNTQTSSSSSTSTGKYHVIVASSIEKSKAATLVAKLKALGYAAATILEGNTVRVSLESFNTREEATKALNTVRSKDGFSDAWVLSR